ncbi:unnamed protein product [Hermetia illucens]|uniref:Uncharacterized protein n=2 Tax=Hermetia illucens TaxID=343691 RepID=A0A7R8V7E2_HERIL|nr:unnamed protein product [Hermetia illucens]
MHSIFDRDEDGLLIADKIMSCSNLEISQGQNLPEQICMNCLSELKTAYHFRSNCENSNTVLEAFTKGDIVKDLVVCSVKGKVYEYKPPEGLDIKRIRKSATPPPSEASEKKETFEELMTISKLEMDEEDIITEELEETENEKNGNLTHYEISILGEETSSENPVIVTVPKNTARKNGNSKRNTAKQARAKGEKPLYICELCGNIFKHNHALETHMRRHRKEKPFSCEICGRGFVLNVELTCHMRTHTGQKPYACRYCDRRFSDFGSRIKHERSHTGERPYSCGTCGKAFAYSYGLSSHMLTHTGEKPEKCEKCGKRFTKKHHLTNHLKTHLKQELALKKTQQMAEQAQQVEDSQNNLLTILQSDVNMDQYVEEVTMIDGEENTQFEEFEGKPTIIFYPDVQNL